MSWFENTANETESDEHHVYMFLAVDFDFPSGHVRVWTGHGDITIASNVFTGVGTLGKIGTPDENDRLVAEKKVYQLTGVDPALVSESDIDNCFGRSVKEYFGFIDTQAMTLVDVPELNWEGRIDQINRTDGKNPVIEVSAEHRMVMLDQSVNFRYTDEHQKQYFPDDNFFDQVASIGSKTLVWGGARVVVGEVDNSGGRYGTGGDVGSGGGTPSRW